MQHHPSVTGKELPCSIAVIIAVAAVVITTAYSYNWSDSDISNIALLMANMISSVLLGTQLVTERRYFTVHIGDVLFLAFVLIILSLSLLKSSIAGNEQLSFLIFSFNIFLIVRMIGSSAKNILKIGCGLLLIAELSIGCKQLIDIENWSDNSYLFLTGTAGNVNLYCCLLLVLGTISTPLLLRMTSRGKWLLISLLWILLSAVIIFAQAKACFLAYSVVMTLHLITALRTKYSSRSNILRYALKLIPLGTIFAGLILIKISNSDSSIGRLLVWTITLSHIPDVLFSGIGYGQFPVKYPNWQIEFFKNSEVNSDFKRVADMTYEVFCEPLQILIECGLVGFVVFIYLCYTLLNDFPNSKYNDVQFFKYALLGLLVFSLFSYPLHSAGLLLLFILCISMILNEQTYNLGYKISFNDYVRPLVLFAFILSCLQTYSLYETHNASRLWRIIRNQSRYSEKDSREILENSFSTLRYNGIFLNDYAKTLYLKGDYLNAIKMFEESRKFYINEDTFEYLAASNLQLNNFEISRSHLRDWSSLIPSRFRPRYLIAESYLKQGNLKEAKKIAIEIINMPIKVPSDEVTGIRSAMSDILFRADHE